MDLFEKEKKEANKEQQTLRERNIEKQQIATAKALRNSGTFLSLVTILLYIGYIALVVILVSCYGRVSESAVDVENYKTPSSTAMIAEIRKLLKDLNTVFDTAKADRIEDENSCEGTVDDKHPNVDPYDDRGNDKYGCPSLCGDLRDTLPSTCRAPHSKDRGEVDLDSAEACSDSCISGLTECQLGSKSKLRDKSNSKCVYWIFVKDASWLFKKFRFHDTEGRIITRGRCFLYPDYSEAFNNYKLSGSTEETRSFGFNKCYYCGKSNNCKQKRLVKAMTQFYRNFTLEYPRDIEFKTTQIKSFSDHACEEWTHYAGGDHAATAIYKEMFHDVLDRAYAGGTMTDLHAICSEYAIAKGFVYGGVVGHSGPTELPPIPTINCFTTTADRLVDTYEECQKMCNEDDTCTHVTYTSRYSKPGGSKYGNINKYVCLMYSDVSVKYTDGHSWRHIYGMCFNNGGACYKQTKSGTRFCEKTDYRKRNEVPYKYTPDIYLPCGTVLDGVDMTGDAVTGVTGSAADKRACSELCTDHETCNYWKFDVSCALFTKATNVTAKKSGATSGSRNCARLCEKDVAYVSSGAKPSTVDTAAKCLAKCHPDPTCIKWSWSSSNKECLLHTSKNAKLTDSSGAVSGSWYCKIKEIKCPLGDTGVVIVGDILTTSPIEVEDWGKCAVQCKNNPRCNFWQCKFDPSPPLHPLCALGFPFSTWSMCRPIPPKPPKCFLYADDKLRTNLSPSDYRNHGHRDCQADTESTVGGNNTVSEFIDKPAEWLHQPFVCSTRGEKITLGEDYIGRFGDTKVVSTQGCNVYCNEETVEAYPYGTSTVGGKVQRPVAWWTVQGSELCYCITQSQWNNIVTKVRDGDLNKMYKNVLGYPGCKPAERRFARRHYTAYHAIFVGYGCAREDCILGAEVGDHVITSVDTVDSCVEQCHRYGKMRPVHRLTYSSGYKMCYCHEEEGGQKKGSFYASDSLPTEEEYLNYVLY